MKEIMRFLSEIPYNETVVPLLIDIGLICWFVRGYFKGNGDGFLATAYDLGCLLFINLFSFTYCRSVFEHLTVFLHRYPILSFVADCLNIVRVFILMIIVLSILCGFVNSLLRKHFTQWVEHFALMRSVNQLIGGLLGVIKSLSVSYIIISLSLMQTRLPYLYQEVSRSVVASRLVNIIPSLDRQIQETHENLLYLKGESKELSKQELERLIHFLCYACDIGLFAEAKAVGVVEDHLADAVISLHPDVTLRDKAAMMALVIQTDLSDAKKERVRANLVV